jgi:hypothetical protein
MKVHEIVSKEEEIGEGRKGGRKKS